MPKEAQTRVAIMGGTGYTALELLTILLQHPHAEVCVISSRQTEPVPVSEIHPVLNQCCEINMENHSHDEIAQKADFVFCALPHTASMAAIPELLSYGMRVIDLSADYRLSDPGVYEQWYGEIHTDPTRLGTTVYGLPELFRDQIPTADLIANPGCYTSTSILSLAPFLKADLIEPQGIIIDAKSGISGAGRKPKAHLHYPECNESVSAYGVGTHRHTPEINQILSRFSEQDVNVTFTPHLMPMDRGIYATIYPRLKESSQSLTQGDLLEIAKTFYKNEPFVRVVEELPSTKQTSRTNFFDMTIRLSEHQMIILATLDNLMKGAAGVAIQNFNLMLGIDETTGLL